MKATQFTLLTALVVFIASCGGPADGEFTYPTNYDDAVKSFEEQKKILDAQQVRVDSVAALRDSFDSTLVGEKLPEVYLSTLKKSTFESFVEVHGVVESDKNIVVMPEMSGVIRSIEVKEGSVVRKGKVLARIDTDVIRTQIKELEKRLELAVELFKKQENLRKENVGTEIAYLEAKNNKEALEQQIKSLNVQAGKATIKSPIDGKIDEILPNLGEMISPQAPFCRIVNTSDVYINSDVSEALLSKIEKGQEVQVRFPYQKDTVQLKVDYVGNYINPNNRTFKVHTSLSGASKKYPPNLLAVVRFKDLSLNDVITIPGNVIQNDGTSDFVFVVRGGKAEKVSIKTGPSFMNNTVIYSDDLKPGDKLVFKGYRRLSNGMEVKEVTSAIAAK